MFDHSVYKFFSLLMKRVFVLQGISFHSQGSFDFHHGNPSGGGVGGGGGGGGPPMSDFMHGPQLSHPPDAPGGLHPQDKPLNHGMNDTVSRLRFCIYSNCLKFVNFALTFMLFMLLFLM